jgi:hypothetical protein
MDEEMMFYVESYNKADSAEKALRHVGDYATLEEAIAASKKEIDESLMREFKAGMSASQLFGKFQAYGDMPCIFRTDDKTLSNLGFNALVYAKEASAKLCEK